MILAILNGRVAAQNQWIDSILPPDHLLENLPWMGEDGKVESKGLFDFEDMRSIGQKDLILIYRQSVPVNELDKPHNQTLVVCFYDSKLQRYVKNFEDEGGPIQWVKLLPGADKKNLTLMLQRDDLNSEIWCSSKNLPKEKADAEHVFSWDEAKSQYAEGKTSSTAGWTGASISVPVTIAAVEEKSGKSNETKAVVSAPKAGHPSKNGWWDDPLDAQAASVKLNTELTPRYIKKGQIAVLGQKARAFFGELQKKKVDGKSINGMRAGYYAAVASTLLDMGNKKDAMYYLKTAFSFQVDNPDALALKEKMKN